MTLKGTSRGLQRGPGGGLGGGLQKGTSEGTSKRTCHVKLRSGKVQVWFSLELRFKSLELDSKVGRLVYF